MTLFHLFFPKIYYFPGRIHYILVVKENIAIAKTQEEPAQKKGEGVDTQQGEDVGNYEQGEDDSK